MAIFFIPGFNNTLVLYPIMLSIFVIGIFLGDYFEIEYGLDPKEFTLDEFLGTWIAFIFTPKTPFLIILTFVIWRIFDIIKPFPANKVENLKGGLGIMMDDVVSGMYSCIFIYIFKLLFY